MKNCQIAFFGFRTRTHGWQEVLTVVSRSGAAAVARLAVGDGLEVQSMPGHLTRFLEKKSGAIDDFIEQHAIVELTRAEWESKKIELGRAIY